MFFSFLLSLIVLVCFLHYHIFISGSISHTLDSSVFLLFYSVLSPGIESLRFHITHIYIVPVIILWLPMHMTVFLVKSLHI